MHFLTFWFFIHAFETLSYLSDTRLLDLVRHSNNQDLSQKLTDNKISAGDLTNFVVWTSASGLVGLLVAFIISLSISIRRHWFWFNPLIVLMVTYVLYSFDLLGWTYSRNICWRIGQTFSSTITEFTINGCVLLTIGLLIFFLKRSNTFIENRKIATAKH
jgi:hypothetical protein